MSKYRLLALICVACAFTGSGCATILNGGPDVVFIQSEPSGAKVSVDGNYVGLSPVTASVSRSALVVTFSKEGYLPVSFPIQKSFNSWVLANFFFLHLALPGLLIDGIAGNFSEVHPFIAVTLPKDESSEVQGANGPDSIAVWLGRLRQYAELSQADPPGKR